MAESLSRAFASLREFLDGLGWGAVADGSTWAALWKTATTPQGVAFIATVAVALGLGLLVGYLWARPRRQVPATEPAPVPLPQASDPEPEPEAQPEAPPPPDAPANALRATLQDRGLSEAALAERVGTFVAGLEETRASLATLLAEDTDTSPLIRAAARALDYGDFDTAVRALDLARGRFGATGRALASRASTMRLAAATAATLAGDLEMSRCEYAAAAKLFARALDLLRATETERILPLLTKRATAAFRGGAPAEADALLQRAVGIAEEAHGAEHPELAKALSCLAFVRYATGDPAEADRLYQRSLAIDEKALGADHPTVATDLYNLAQLGLRQGNRAAAEPLLQRTLAIRRKALGPDHPETLRAARNYADLLRQMDRAQDAEQVLADVALAQRQAESVVE